MLPATSSERVEPRHLDIGPPDPVAAFPIVPQGTVPADAPADGSSREAALFLDRDLSLLRFQRRVLEEAQDERNPLLERVKFLAILGTNLDDFTVVRGAKLRLDPTRWHAAETATIELLRDASLYLRERLLPQLAASGLHVLSYADLNAVERAGVDAGFREHVLPLVKPVACAPEGPFPEVAGRGLNFAVVLRAESGDERVALVGVPDSVDPLLSFDWRRSNDRAAATRTDRGFVWTEQVLQAHLTAAFPGMTVVSSHRFRLMRDADLSMPVDETLHPLRRVDALIRHRRTSPAVVLVVDRTLPAAPLKLLSDRLDVPAAHIRAVRSVSDLQRLWDVARIPRAELHDAELHQPVPAALSGQVDPFAVMRERSVLLHHPYESFQPVVDLIDKAGADPDVEQISMSLYRTDRESPVAHALLAALQRGKQVRVVVELNARFDEERNAAWARTLERAGAQVLYGVDGLKVHAKTAMIARREGAALRRYVHLSSGNYNAFTSRVYTDLGLLTADEAIASDVSSLFDFIGGGPTPTRFRRLLVAPFTLRRTLGDLIEREIGWARRGVDAHLILKMNALSDRETIRQLYRASEAGVKIDLIVRGICCLRPGLCGLSRNIAVRSVVGQFLEHSRAWYFRNGGKEEAFIGSADVMPRNLDRRIEIMTPLTDQALVRRIRDEVLGLYLADNVKARLLVGDGTYVRPTLRRDEPAIVSQTALLERAGMRFPGPSGVRSQHSAALVPAP